MLVRRTCDFGVDEYEHFKNFFASHNQAIEFSTREANASTTKPKAYLTSHRYCGKEFGYRPINHADPFNHSDGVPIMYWDGLNIRKRTCKTSVLESRFKDCAALHRHNPTKPTSGFSAAIFVFISGLCTSLDLYGYSTTGTAKTKYWEFAHATSGGREAKPFVYKYGTEEMMKEARDVTHSLDLEYEWWRAMMEAGNSTGACTVRFIEASPEEAPSEGAPSEGAPSEGAPSEQRRARPPSAGVSTHASARPTGCFCFAERFLSSSNFISRLVERASRRTTFRIPSAVRRARRIALPALLISLVVLAAAVFAVRRARGPPPRQGGLPV